MTNEQLEEILLKYAKQGNCFTQEVRSVLLNYKELGGEQVEVVAILNSIKEDYPNNLILQEGVDDILDIATGYCGRGMLVWE